MLKVPLILLLFFAGTGSAQTKTFRYEYETGLCRITATYNSKKYTEIQLRNTLKLFEPSGFQMSYDATVWKYEDIPKLNVEDLDREYQQKTAALKTLKIVKADFWEGLRQAKLRELEQLYRLSRITMRAYKNPQVLKEYARAESCKIKYAEPLIAGGESLIEIWREVNKDSQKNNGDPARLQRRFDQENASVDRLKFALIETMMFGWWNCANDLIDREESSRNGLADDEFRKLFIRAKEVCDQP